MDGPTGFGFQDATTRTLRMNMYDIADGRTPTASEHVNVCLEHCRRMAKFDWQPTAESAARIAAGVQYWPQLPVTEVAYFTRKLAIKYPLLNTHKRAQDTRSLAGILFSTFNLRAWWLISHDMHHIWLFHTAKNFVKKTL